MIWTESTRRKVDLWLLPLLGMLYALALIDRTNLGVARIVGMDADLVRAFNLPHTAIHHWRNEGIVGGIPL
jgi:hypothetical protein